MRRHCRFLPACQIARDLFHEFADGTYRKAVEPDPNPHPDYRPRERRRRYAADFPAALFPTRR